MGVSKSIEGEGSRGGVIIGHTKSGKPVYSNSHNTPSHGWSAQDHKDAASVHTKVSDKEHDEQLSAYEKWRKEGGKRPEVKTSALGTEHYRAKQHHEQAAARAKPVGERTRQEHDAIYQKESTHRAYSEQEATDDRSDDKRDQAFAKREDEHKAAHDKEWNDAHKSVPVEDALDDLCKSFPNKVPFLKPGAKIARKRDRLTEKVERKQQSTMGIGKQKRALKEGMTS